jgi:hypothetical protein
MIIVKILATKFPLIFIDEKDTTFILNVNIFIITKLSKSKKKLQLYQI